MSSELLVEHLEKNAYSLEIAKVHLVNDCPRIGQTLSP